MVTMVTLKPKPKTEKPRGKPFRGFALSDEADSRLDALARKYGLSRSSVIRQLIDQVYEAEFSKGGAA